MCDGTIRLKLQLRERRMLGRKCRELEMKMQKKAVWKLTKKNRESLNLYLSEQKES